MRCPECGGELGKTSVVGTDDSFRCQVCHGVWLEGWAVNQVADGKQLLIDKGGKPHGGEWQRVCPTDESILARPADVPEKIRCWRCPKCSWWWFSGDEIFSLEQAFTVKRKYLEWWRVGSEWPDYVLPALVVLVLVTGILVGTKLIGMRQQVGVPASGR